MYEIPISNDEYDGFVWVWVLADGFEGFFKDSHPFENNPDGGLGNWWNRSPIQLRSVSINKFSPGI